MVDVPYGVLKLWLRKGIRRIVLTRLMVVADNYWAYDEEKRAVLSHGLVGK